VEDRAYEIKIVSVRRYPLEELTWWEKSMVAHMEMKKRKVN